MERHGKLNYRKYAKAAEPTGHLGSQASMQLRGLQEQRSSSHLQTASMQRPSRILSCLRGRRGKFSLLVRICFGIAWNCNCYTYATGPVPNSMQITRNQVPWKTWKIEVPKVRQGRRANRPPGQSGKHATVRLATNKGHRVICKLQVCRGFKDLIIFAGASRQVLTVRANMLWNCLELQLLYVRHRPSAQ